MCMYATNAVSKLAPVHLHFNFSPEQAYGNYLLPHKIFNMKMSLYAKIIMLDNHTLIYIFTTDRLLLKMEMILGSGGTSSTPSVAPVGNLVWVCSTHTIM